MVQETRRGPTFGRGDTGHTERLQDIRCGKGSGCSKRSEQAHTNPFFLLCDTITIIFNTRAECLSNPDGFFDQRESPMRLQRLAAFLAAAILVSTVPLPTIGAEQAMHHQQHGHQKAQQVAGDNRTLVEFPAPMRQHMLSNMRDHLLALEAITRLLAEGEYEAASETAETRLGMSAMQAHGGAHMAPFMPDAMRTTGSAMHRAASRFAVAARDAEVTGDLSAAFGALSQVMQQCVACHESFRVH